MQEIPEVAKRRWLDAWPGTIKRKSEVRRHSRNV